MIRCVIIDAAFVISTETEDNGFRYPQFLLIFAYLYLLMPQNYVIWNYVSAGENGII